MVDFATPFYGLLLALVPVLIVLYLHSARQRRQAVAMLIAPALRGRLVRGGTPGRRATKAGLTVGAVALLAVALMGPLWGTSYRDVPRQGRDLIVLLDVSLSMTATDAAPNRLDAAKSRLEALAVHVADDGGHRLGLMTFAGRPDLQCPLTLDYDFFRDRLARVDAEAASRPGSHIGDALRQALTRFGIEDPEFTDVLILTDGEDHGSLPTQAARAAAEEGIRIFAAGLGDAVTGAPIPSPDEAADSDFIIYEGRVVQSRMRQSLLAELARTSGGNFIDATEREDALVSLYDEFIAGAERRTIQTAQAKQPTDQFHWLVLAALMLLCADALLPERARHAR